MLAILTILLDDLSQVAIAIMRMAQHCTDTTVESKAAVHDKIYKPLMTSNIKLLGDVSYIIVNNKMKIYGRKTITLIFLETKIKVIEQKAIGKR